MNSTALVITLLIALAVFGLGRLRRDERDGTILMFSAIAIAVFAMLSQIV